ncbi:MAG: alpha/beta hydrolase-fold protein [Caldilineales bacterium]
MKIQKYGVAAFSLMLIAVLLAACAAPAAAPSATSISPTATATFAPPTATTTSLPPTATATMVSPTAAPTISESPTVPAPTPPGKITVEIGEITSQALAGNLLGDPATRKFYVFLPPGYDASDKHYPVVYVLHGYTDNETGLAGNFKNSYDKALAEGDVQEMIFVFPNAHNKLGGSCYLSSPTIGDYGTYISQELVAQIDATYRTIPDPASRGITGCSMGGDGSMYLALKHPDVFGVAAPASGRYDWGNDGVAEFARESFTGPPSTLSAFNSMSFPVQVLMAETAGAASNPDKPPYYMDMPLEIVNGEAQIVPEVLEKLEAVDAVHALDDYLAQPERLSAVLIYHATQDDMVPVELAHNFDQLLTDKGVDHEYLEVMGSHCYFGLKDYLPVVEFMSDHLVGEEQPVSEQAPAALPAAADQPASPAAASTARGDMKLTIVYDNSTTDTQLIPEHGFAAVIEYDGHQMLFDTGTNGSLLLENMRLLGIDPRSIEKVIISHGHPDHTGGLLALLDTGVQPTVYAPANVLFEIADEVRAKTELVEVTDAMEILPGVHLTQPTGSVIEQALVLDTRDGSVVITGCAHPGVVNIVRQAQALAGPKIALLAGGFHLSSLSDSELPGIVAEVRQTGVSRVMPCHCTGARAIGLFRNEYGDDFVKGGVGATVAIPIS